MKCFNLTHPPCSKLTLKYLLQSWVNKSGFGILLIGVHKGNWGTWPSLISKFVVLVSFSDFVNLLGFMTCRVKMSKTFAMNPNLKRPQKYYFWNSENARASIPPLPGQPCTNFQFNFNNSSFIFLVPPPYAPPMPPSVASSTTEISWRGSSKMSITRKPARV